MWHRQRGCSYAPKGAATLVALERLLKDHFLDPDEKIVLLNTGSGYKYLDLLRN